MEWHNDTELFQLMRTELYTAVVGDIMDTLHYRHQFLPPQIKPLRNDMIVAGRAMTVLEADVFEEQNPPFGLMLEALDSLKENEIYVATGSSPAYALWGELMSTRARAAGAVGAVLDGYSRDTRGILHMGFPTFSYGTYSQDQAVRGRVIDHHVELEIGQARIRPGDILFGDIDGVLVVPREIEVETMTKALEKARSEKVVKKALEQGMTAAEAFRKYGIL
jgi:regulator of RNase E activity RraA